MVFASLVISNNSTSFSPVSRSTSDSKLPSLANAPWLKQPATRGVLEALEAQGHTARVVGGAVRNALLHEPVQDIDIATTATPDEIIETATMSGLTSVPTGIDHGTVTVIADKKPFEVTTLRRDVETDGRRAVVAFTDDWTEDAQRRDFTINALYSDKDGVLFDPVGGYEDIKQQRVRFIGDADQRIKEDYLRILRFFRFTATYGQGQCDASGLASCSKLRAGLDKLAGERIWVELKKLLVAPHASDVLGVMESSQILASLIEPDRNVDQFKRMVAIDAKLDRTGNPVQRLAALCGHTNNDVRWLRDRLRFSTRAFERLTAMVQNTTWPASDASEHDTKIHLYRHGPEAYCDAVLLAWARSGADPDNTSWLRHVNLVEHWQIPKFPFAGSDVLALGLDPGPKVGQILSQLETWWISEGFPDDPERLKQQLLALARVTKP